MQDITEQQDRAQEISDAISRPFGEVYDEVKVINFNKLLYQTNNDHCAKVESFKFAVFC